MFGNSYLYGAADYEVYYGRTYGVAEGSLMTDGDGNVDIEGAIKAADASGVKHICYEQDTWPLGFDSLDYSAKKSFDYIQSLIK